MAKLTPMERLIQARMRLQKEKPFFSYLTMHLKLREDKTDELACGSMGVSSDGECIFSPDFVTSLSDEELKGVLCHEVMHCALEHLVRIDNRNPSIWNASVDIVVNNMLVKDGLHLPKDGLVPYQNEIQLLEKHIKNISEKSAEEIYDEVYSDIRKKLDKVQKKLQDYINEHKDELQGFDEHLGEGSGDDKDSKKKQKQNKLGQGNSLKGKLGKKESKNWKKILVDAVTFAKQRGQLPAGMERLVDKVLETHIDWKALLYKYITNQIPIDYNWTKPSKRSFSTGVYMPGVEKEKIDIVVSIDTSGSISDDELSEFLSEVISIIRRFKNVDLTLISCDSKIHNVQTYKNATIDDALDFKLSGRGGTSHVPVYRWILENMPQAKLLINFTDGYTEFPDSRDVNVKSLWVICGYSRNLEIPFGEVIELPARGD